ncbi:MAG: putative Ig domain-containing protein, partial [Pseudomonadota bacterium]
QADGSDLPIWMSFDPDTGSLTGTPPADFNGVFDLVLTASDGELSANAALRFTVDPVNDTPILQIALPDVVSDEDAPVAFTLDAFAFDDIDGDALTLSATLSDGSTLPEWLEFNGASFTGTPPADFNGDFSITVTASDGEFEASDTFTLAIAPVNDAPILVSEFADIERLEDTAVDAMLDLTQFSDIDGDALSYTLLQADGSDLPAWLAFNEGALQGVPPTDFNGTIALTITASDGELSVSDSFNLVITPVNDAPFVLTPLSDVASLEDTAFNVAVPADTFRDVDGDVLTLSAQLVGGEALPDWLTFDGDELIGTPPQDFNGGFDIEILATDGALSTSATFRLDITAVNDAPVVLIPLNDYVVGEDQAIDIALPIDGIADVDGDTLTIAVTLAGGDPLPAWLTFDGTRLTGTPPQDFNGLIALQLTASDGEESVSDPFDLTILAVNDAPIVVTPLADLSSAEDEAFAFAIDPASFADVDGDALTLSAMLGDGSDLPSWVAFDGANLTGTPPADFNGSFDIIVTASDGLLSAASRFTFTIDPVNDAPVLLAPLADQTSVEDEAIGFTVPTDAFGDIDGDALTLTASLANGDALPDWLSFDGAAFTGTPPANFNGSVEITVNASDGEFSVEDSFVLTITPENDAPVLVAPLADQSFAEDSAVSFAIPAGSFADVEGDALTFSAALANGDALPGWLAFDGIAFTGTPPQDLNGAFEITVTASDGALTATDTFTLTLEAVNDAPVLVQALADIEAAPSDTLSIDLATGVFADVDGDALTLTATLANGDPLPDWLTFDGSVLSSTSVPNLSAQFDILVTANDGAESVSDTFRISVAGGNSAPTAEDDGVFVTTSNRELVIDPLTLLENDIDAEGDTLEIISVQDAIGGEIGFDEEGFIIFTPDAVFEGDASFTYTISDGEFTSQATVSITVDPSDQFDDYRQGNDNNNRMFGSFFGRNRIFGAGGNDRIVGGLNDDELAGGDGDDIIFGLFGNDDLYGGQGDDYLLGGFGFDTAHFFGYRADHEIFTSGGIFNLRVVDVAPGVDGDDGVDRLSSIEQLAFKGGETLNIASPIILDLAGDGVQTLSAEESDALFDLDSDGLADDTSWIGINDAFLFLDRDADGTMSGVEEISFIDDVEDAATDLAGLVAFDSNGDGVLSADDERFEEFGVWQDRDGDGAVDEGETATLREVGIESISLTGTPFDGVTQFGEVAIANTGSFTLTNGATGEFADAALTYFSAATNVPELSVTDYSFERKAKKYRIHFSNGFVAVDRKKRTTNASLVAGQLGADTILDFDGETYGRFAPIVLDLDGDGVDLVRRKRSNATFDYQGNGAQADTGWISGSDAFLVIDRDNDGLITQGSELSLAAEDEAARSGLQGLARLDSNGDGLVDGDDARFGELRIWQDANENGVTDAGELRTLDEEGIVSLSLSVAGQQGRVKVTKNAITAVTTFTRANGATGTAADVSLAYRPAAAPPQPPTGAIAQSGLGLAGDVSFEPFNGAPFLGGASALDDVFDQLRNGSEAGLTGLFDRFDRQAIQPLGVSTPEMQNLRDAGAVASRWLDPSATLVADYWVTQSTSDKGFAYDSRGALQAELGLDYAIQGRLDAKVTQEAHAERAHVLPTPLDRTTAESDMARVSIEAVELDAGVASEKQDAAITDTARKLMIIRQEMNTFGANSDAEVERIHDLRDDYLQIFG